jgi:hypothetical protein
MNSNYQNHLRFFHRKNPCKYPDIIVKKKLGAPDHQKEWGSPIFTPSPPPSGNIY